MRWDNADGTLRLARVSPDEKTGPWKDFPSPVGFERNWMFLDELRHFRDVLQGEAEPACTLQDGIKALQLSLAALFSSQYGSVVNLMEKK